MPMKTLVKICFTHESHEFFIIGQIHARLSHELKWVVARLLPSDEFGQQLLYMSGIAYEVVVHDEHASSPPRPVERIQLGQNLTGGLGAGDTTVHDHDVAKFAVERTSPGVLHRHGGVIFHGDEAPVRHRRSRDVGPLFGFVKPLRRASVQVCKEERQCDLGLVQHEMVHLGEKLVLGGEQRPSSHNGFVHALAPGDDFLCGCALYEHAADKDKVGFPDMLVQKGARVDIHQGRGPILRQHGRHSHESQWREGGFLGNCT